MKKTHKSTRFLSLMMTVVLLISVLSAGMAAKAAASVTITPVAFESFVNGGWFEPDTGMVSLKKIDPAEHTQTLTEGTYYFMFGTSGTYTASSSNTVAIITVDANGNVTVKDGKFTYNSWDSSPVTELSTKTAIVYGSSSQMYVQWGGNAPPVKEDPGNPVLRRVAVTVKASDTRDHMGYGNALTAGSAADDETLHTVHAAGTVYLNPGDDYLFYMVKGQAGSWYFNTYADCVRIKVDEHGCITTSGASFDWNGVSNTSTLNYVIEPSIGGVILDYKENSEPQMIVTAEMQGVIDDGGVYGPGVSDRTLDEWAQINHDLATVADGSDRQAFSVNSVKNLIAKLGKPARTLSKIEFNQNTLDYYAEQKQLNAAYMKHESYEYSNYFLHDYYAQGIWDSMPAAYGWMQDEFTTPGKIIMKKVPELKGLSHGLTGGGQNPYVLCDYLERMSGTADTPAVEGTAGVGWYHGYDEIAETPYLWNPTEGIFLTYENEQSLRARADYVNQKGLGGVIIWEISGDNTAYYNMTRILKEELKDKGKNVIAYFVNWAVYNKYHQYQSPDFIPWDKLTCINYSFFQIGGYSESALELPANTIQSFDSWADDYKGDYADNAPNMLRKFADLKEQYPDVKVMASIGGWTRGDGFGTMVATKENRTTFINSIIEFMKTYTFFDGIDLDWEYPGAAREPDYDDPNDQGVTTSGDDFKNYADFVSELRIALDAEFKSTGRNLISACCPGSESKLAHQDLDRLTKDLTWLNMMTYDYHGAFDPTIGYNSPLYAHPETPDEWSTDTTIRYLEDKNIDLSKVNIGAAFYSRGWAGVIPDEYNNPAPLADPTPIFPTGEDTVTVTPTNSTIKVNDKLQLNATATSGNIIQWTSSNPAVAAVSNTGLVTGVTEGTVTITATSSSGKSGTAKVTVVKGETTGKEIVMKFDAAKAYVDGSVYPTTQYANGYATLTNVSGTAMMPLRYIAEVSGFDVAYDEATQKTKVTNKANGEYLLVTPGSNAVSKYSSAGTLIGTSNAPSAFTISNGVTMGPLRFTCEALGMYVNYQETNHGIYVTVTSTSKTTDEALALIEKVYGLGL